MSEDRREPVSIDWPSAEVQAGTLTVDLTGDPSAEWAQRVHAVVKRLRRSSDRWGDIDLEASQLTVSEVSPGAEAHLRLLLEGVTQQANADLAPDATRDEDDKASEADRAMTEAFRAFAEPA